MQPPAGTQRSQGGHALGRRALGGLLFAAGLLAIGPALLYLVALVAVTIGERGSRLLPDMLLALLAVLVSAALLYQGNRMLRAGRGMVLFLRRFGFDEATQAVTQAVARRLGWRWRVLTLDDDRVAPMGVPRHTTFATGAVALLSLVVVAIGALFVTVLFASLKSDAAQAGHSWEAAAAAIIQTFVEMFVVMVISVFVILPLSVLASVGAGSLLLLYGMRRSETRNRIHIADAAQIDALVASVSSRARRFSSGRFLVARVAPQIWQPTVAALARQASVVLVDVSRPSPALVWEVRMLQATGSPHCIYIGEHNSLRALANAARLPGVAADLGKLLQRQEVLAYGKSPAEHRQFARALGQRLPRH